jgi:hypothetical protein
MDEMQARFLAEVVQMIERLDAYSALEILAENNVGREPGTSRSPTNSRSSGFHTSSPPTAGTIRTTYASGLRLWRCPFSLACSPAQGHLSTP